MLQVQSFRWICHSGGSAGLAYSIWCGGTLGPVGRWMEYRACFFG